MTNVRDFGAVGDGRTDDTAALKHAVEQGGGWLLLPRGTYRLTAPLEIDLDRSGPIALSGQGGTARLLMDGPGPAIRLVGTHHRSADPASFEARIWQRQRMPTISDLEIVGNHDQADGIQLDGTMQPTIAGVLIRRCRYGVHLVKRNRNVLLADSHIYEGRGPAIGVYFEGVNLHQTIVCGCHISYCKHAGIKVARSEIRNLQITGCDIEYNHDTANPDSADVWIDAREGTVREGTIASNTIQAKGSPHGSNVRIEGPPRDDSAGAGLWTITGNILQDQQVNLRLRYCRGVVVTGNSFATAYERSIVVEHCRHVVIGSNTCDHNPDYSGERLDGIRIRNSAGINLQNLILEGCRAGGPDEGGAIEVVDSSEVLILGCQVLDPEFRGIDIRHCRNTKVRECTVVDRRARPTMREPVRVVGLEP
ncbi:MAG TPA: right-handed parallel beta-helix repeat-containing protein [Isosphaeraceae bacterium]|nr:right-handed parallel beta-helix repeat-containing protein [Isosphaeraceae bacterium]